MYILCYIFFIVLKILRKNFNSLMFDIENEKFGIVQIKFLPILYKFILSCGGDTAIHKVPIS